MTIAKYGRESIFFKFGEQVGVNVQSTQRGISFRDDNINGGIFFQKTYLNFRTFVFLTQTYAFNT